ncbi:hypothetical protein PCE1_003771 [Barthelona sp. PCE]
MVEAGEIDVYVREYRKLLQQSIENSNPEHGEERKIALLTSICSLMQRDVGLIVTEAFLSVFFEASVEKSYKVVQCATKSISTLIQTNLSVTQLVLTAPSVLLTKFIRTDVEYDYLTAVMAECGIWIWCSFYYQVKNPDSLPTNIIRGLFPKFGRLCSLVEQVVRHIGKLSAKIGSSQSSAMLSSVHFVSIFAHIGYCLDTNVSALPTNSIQRKFVVPGSFPEKAKSRLMTMAGSFLKHITAWILPRKDMAHVGIFVAKCIMELVPHVHHDFFGDFVGVIDSQGCVTGVVSMLDTVQKRTLIHLMSKFVQNCRRILSRMATRQVDLLRIVQTMGLALGVRGAKDDLTENERQEELRFLVDLFENALEKKMIDRELLISVVMDNLKRNIPTLSVLQEFQLDESDIEDDIHETLDLCTPAAPYRVEEVEVDEGALFDAMAALKPDDSLSASVNLVKEMLMVAAQVDDKKQFRLVLGVLRSIPLKNPQWMEAVVETLASVESGPIVAYIMDHDPEIAAPVLRELVQMGVDVVPAVSKVAKHVEVYIETLRSTKSENALSPMIHLAKRPAYAEAAFSAFFELAIQMETSALTCYNTDYLQSSFATFTRQYMDTGCDRVFDAMEEQDNTLVMKEKQVSIETFLQFLIQVNANGSAGILGLMRLAARMDNVQPLINSLSRINFSYRLTLSRTREFLVQELPVNILEVMLSCPFEADPHVFISLATAIFGYYQNNKDYLYSLLLTSRGLNRDQLLELARIYVEHIQNCEEDDDESDDDDEDIDLDAFEAGMVSTDMQDEKGIDIELFTKNLFDGIHSNFYEKLDSGVSTGEEMMSVDNFVVPAKDHAYFQGLLDQRETVSLDEFLLHGFNICANTNETLDTFTQFIRLMSVNEPIRECFSRFFVALSTEERVSNDQPIFLAFLAVLRVMTEAQLNIYTSELQDLLFGHLLGKLQNLEYYEKENVYSSSMRLFEWIINFSDSKWAISLLMTMPITLAQESIANLSEDNLETFRNSTANLDVPMYLQESLRG